MDKVLNKITKPLQKIKHLRVTMLQYADEKFPKKQKSGRLLWPEWFKKDFDFINHLEVDFLAKDIVFDDISNADSADPELSQYSDDKRPCKEDMYRCNHIYKTYKVVYDTI